LSLNFKFVAQSDERAVLMLRQITPRVGAALARRMQEVVILMRDRIVALKLSGQVLRNRTGTLRRSITTKVTRQPDVITGIVGVGSKAWYGKLHEYGGTFAVPAHERVSSKGKAYTVRAHSVHFKQRSFMRSTLRESQGKIRDTLALALKEAVNG
jgi:phage gpG-like protein